MLPNPSLYCEGQLVGRESSKEAQWYLFSVGKHARSRGIGKYDAMMTGSPIVRHIGHRRYLSLSRLISMVEVDAAR